MKREKRGRKEGERKKKKGWIENWGMQGHSKHKEKARREKGRKENKERGK